MKYVFKFYNFKMSTNGMAKKYNDYLLGCIGYSRVPASENVEIVASILTTVNGLVIDLVKRVKSIEWIINIDHPKCREDINAPKFEIGKPRRLYTIYPIPEEDIDYDEDIVLNRALEMLYRTIADSKIFSDTYSKRCTLKEINDLLGEITYEVIAMEDSEND